MRPKKLRERLGYDLVDAESLRTAGFNEGDIDARRPGINERNAEAVVVWGAMGGWFPERLPVVLACLDVEHVDGLFDRLLAIRDEIAKSKNG